MLVTRSSVASLQAKQGLPLGTQMVGWLTLGEFAGLSFTPRSFLLHLVPRRLVAGIPVHRWTTLIRASLRSGPRFHKLPPDWTAHILRLYARAASTRHRVWGETGSSASLTRSIPICNVLRASCPIPLSHRRWRLHRRWRQRRMHQLAWNCLRFKACRRQHGSQPR